MQDNGLLRYYKLKAYKDGFLSSKDLNLKIIKHLDGRVSLCDTPVGQFYTKLPRDSKLHRALDPEILLSQIYAKAGLTTAIYLPIETQRGKALISDKIDTEPNIIQACNFLDFEIDLNDRYNLEFLSDENQDVDFSRYFTLRAMQQQTKLRIYDTATFNSDRHDENYFYKVFQVPKPEGTQPFISAKYSPINTDYALRADDIVSIDYELSGLNCFGKTEQNLHSSEASNGPHFENDFEQELLSREEMLKHFRTNPYLENLLDKQELAEEIGSIDPVGVAKDIQETTGYEVDPQYASFLSKSFDEVAEALMQ